MIGRSSAKVDDLCFLQPIQMDRNLKVAQSTKINATPDAVWDMLTNPSKIKEYMFGTNAKTDWQVGSKISFEGEYDGKSYADKGLIKQSVPGKILQYDYWSGFSGLADEPENYSLVTFTIEETEDATELNVEQLGYASEQAQKHSQAAWGQVLVSMKEIAERA